MTQIKSRTLLAQSNPVPRCARSAKTVGLSLHFTAVVKTTTGYNMQKTGMEHFYAKFIQLSHINYKCMYRIPSTLVNTYILTYGFKLWKLCQPPFFTICNDYMGWMDKQTNANQVMFKPKLPTKDWRRQCGWIHHLAKEYHGWSDILWHLAWGLRHCLEPIRVEDSGLRIALHTHKGKGHLI